MTPVRAIHFLELRARIDALRVGTGLPGFGLRDRTFMVTVACAICLLPSTICLRSRNSRQGKHEQVVP